MMYDVGQYCREFRMFILKKPLQEVENGKDIKTLSAFEFGRSSNAHHIFKYYYACDTHYQRRQFMTGLEKTFELGRVTHGE